MKRFVNTGLLIVGLVLASQAASRIQLESYASGFDTIPVAVVNFRAVNTPAITANMPWEVIAADLSFSGRFRVTQADTVDTALFARNGIGIYIDGEYTFEGDRLVLDCYLHDAVTRDLLVGKKYSGDGKLLRNMAHRFSNQIYELLFNENGGFESRMLAVEDKGAVKNVLIMDYDGYNQKQLTKEATVNIFPAFVDSNTIVWTSFSRGKPDIYLGSIAAGSYKAIIYGRYMSTSPAFSAITGRLAYAASKEGNLEVFTSDQQGGDRKQLTFRQSIDTSPCWSPNGYQIAFTSDRSGQPQIYVMDAEGGNQRRLTFAGGYQDAPAWSPKGDKIAYCSLQKGKFDIWTINSDGSDAAKITSCPGNNEYPAWSPTGSHIVFSCNRDGRSDLYIVRADGSGLKQVTRTGDVKMPAWALN
jgi:TolB protein